MRSFSQRLIFPCLVCVCLVLPVAAHGQRLPEGTHQPPRERRFDLLHLRADIDLDVAGGKLAGTATLRLRPLLAPLTTVALDAILLDVQDVAVVAPTPHADLPFRHEGRVLTVELPEPLLPESELVLAVRYTARPKAGMYFQPDPANSDLSYVTTYGEGGLHANWLPIYSDANDKFTTEMVVTVPAPYTVVSNGELVATRNVQGGRTFHWRQDRPHSAYLTALYVGDFEHGTLEPALGGRVPLGYWVPRGRLAEGAYALRNTTRMVDFFSERFDYPYPWAKYDQIAMPDYPVGAMEHTTVTGHSDSLLRGPEAPDDFGPSFDEYSTDWTAEALIAHELAHHWFGNTVTCRSLAQIWLNESFASYLMMLWDETSVGRDQLLWDVEQTRRHYFAYVDEKHRIRPLEYAYFDSPNDIYSQEHTYFKGAAVLHMLRRVLGDDGFFTSLGNYLDRHEFDNVESHDLLAAIAATTGRDLAWFFADWVTGGGHPIFEVSWRYLPKRQLVDLRVQQVQAMVPGQDLFKLPVTITLATATGSRSEEIWVTAAQETFLLPSAEKPLMVSFDGAGDLVAEIVFEKEPEELVYQAKHDALPGRLWAMGQLARRFPGRDVTLATLRDNLGEDGFWVLRAEAARLLGEVRSAAALETATAALAVDDYRVRKAAVLALPSFGAAAVPLLRQVITSDAHNDVVGTAIVALARTDSTVETAFLEKQLRRDAWHDEIRLAVLKAFTELARPELRATVVPYTRPPYNQDVREAAFLAWEAAAPADPKLHTALHQQATRSPYGLQQTAIQMLGRLAVTEAVPLLEDMVSERTDANLVSHAKTALEEIQKIEAAGR